MKYFIVVLFCIQQFYLTLNLSCISFLSIRLMMVRYNKFRKNKKTWFADL